MEYKASLDNLAKLITIGTFVLLLFLGYKSVISLMHSQGERNIILFQSGKLLLFVAIIIGSYIFAPQSYKVDSLELTIVRPIKNRIIQLTDISEILILEKGRFAGGIRTFGVGGLFGYFGKYYYPKIGHVSLYATQGKNKILIYTKDGKKFMITPDDLSIIDELNKKF